MYVNHPLLTITMTDPISVTNSKAITATGGFLHIQQVGAVSIAQSSFQDIKSSTAGSFLYSIASGLTLSVVSSTIDCLNLGATPAGTFDLSSTLDLATPTPDQGGAFYISNALATTTINTLTLRNCHTGSTGGAFSLLDTTISDTNSVYSYNGATRGGAVYCERCGLTLSNV